MRELDVLRHVLQALMHLLALDGGCDLGGDKLQQLLVFFGVAGLLGVALQYQRTDGAFLDLQRHAQPVERCVFLG
ncbi:hypothetical protein D3C72_2411780 [compost metagenome]